MDAQAAVERLGRELPILERDMTQALINEHSSGEQTRRLLICSPLMFERRPATTLSA
ncbi:MAG TPA: hypothetical protein VHV81_11535 [Steroidobacteraceae bacterium]|jgi:hypothetical protein|nr:hypothetical protein [Steroidobacteraceae bacterium]